MRWMRDRHADHPIQGEAGCDRCLQQKLAEARRSWEENLNLSLTTTINELLIGLFWFTPGQRHRDRLRKFEQPSTHRPWGRWEGRGARLSGRAAARPSDKELNLGRRLRSRLLPEAHSDGKQTRRSRRSVVGCRRKSGLLPFWLVPQ